MRSGTLLERDILVCIAVSEDCPRRYDPSGNREKRISFLYGESSSVVTAKLWDCHGVVS